MRKGLKILSTSLLLSSLFVAGCSCEKDDGIKNVSKMEGHDAGLLNGLTGDASRYTFQDVYNALIASNAGNNAVASKLVDFIASDVLKVNDDESVWKSRYQKLIEEKLEEYAESKTLDNGEFSEEYFIKEIKNEGYKVTCPSGVTYGDVDSLACDYSDLINRKFKVEALQTLLKQKYIQEESMKDRPNLLTDKKIKDVEYLTISSALQDNEFKDMGLNVREFVNAIIKRIQSGEVVDFAEVETEFKNKLKALVEEDYAKIGTSKDHSGSIASIYTNKFTQDKSVGRDAKLKAIDDSSYVFTKLIGSDSESAAVVSEDITLKLKTITPKDEHFARKAIAVKEGEANYYYLVDANAGPVVDKGDVLLSEQSSSDSPTVYSFVRFRIIDSTTTNEEEIYKAVELLAKESTLGNGALAHYVKENKDLISVYDDDVKAFLQTLYPDVFAEE